MTFIHPEYGLRNPATSVDFKLVEGLEEISNRAYSFLSSAQTPDDFEKTMNCYAIEFGLALTHATRCDFPSILTRDEGIGKQLERYTLQFIVGLESSMMAYLQKSGQESSIDLDQSYSSLHSAARSLSLKSAISTLDTIRKTYLTPQTEKTAPLEKIG